MEECSIRPLRITRATMVIAKSTTNLIIATSFDSGGTTFTVTVCHVIL